MPHAVLVVDDDVATLSAMVELMSGAGYQTVGASTFDEAKRLLAATRPDLLLADIRLGAFNGLQLVVRGRLDRPDMAAIIITGFADRALEAEAKRYGAVYLVKPVEPARLLRIAAQLLAARAGHRSAS